jgi:hypothetical protein
MKCCLVEGLGCFEGMGMYMGYRDVGWQFSEITRTNRIGCQTHEIDDFGIAKISQIDALEAS